MRCSRHNNRDIFTLHPSSALKNNFSARKISTLKFRRWIMEIFLA